MKQNLVTVKKGRALSVNSTLPTMCDLFIIYSSYITAHVFSHNSLAIVLRLEHSLLTKYNQKHDKEGKLIVRLMIYFSINVLN